MFETYKAGEVVDLGGHKARVVAVDPPDDYRTYGRVIVEALERGLVPAMTFLQADEARGGLQVPEGWGCYRAPALPRVQSGDDF